MGETRKRVAPNIEAYQDEREERYACYRPDAYPTAATLKTISRYAPWLGTILERFLEQAEHEDQ